VRIAYASYYDPGDIRGWSGIGYHISRCLENQGLHIIPMGPLKHQKAPVNVARHLWHRYISRKNDHPQRDPGFLRHYAAQVQRRLARADADLVLGPGTLPLVYLETDLPIVVWTDCTFASLKDYYAKFSNLSERTIRNGHAAEQRALDRADLIIMSCRWAADSAINDYGVDPAKVVLVSFGANLPIEHGEGDLPRILDERPTDRCRLLFMSVDWRRKGGPVALAVAERLHDRGVDVQLDVVGCRPEIDGPLPPFVSAVGFVPKTTPEGLRRLRELFLRSHFFLLPTRADCTPIVYCEASSFAVPSLATDTGGVPEVVRDGVNGKVFPLDADPGAYADYIQAVLRDRDTYHRLARSTFDEYRTRLNWNTAGKRVRALLEELLARRGVGASVR
jgi:glycosyltransferase involved in cell wall biosynthesis